ncbi:CidA/LrgA family protein [Chitinivibrio alkaliphilus]|uniref:LrgA family protein n=1 Tax=Chitinivibrio alkaliphilus ACht1 TaxID=1313304 RepID=U7D4H5_9BACT|nr:CidA/LrgA family protein [Chitinivibrio alkaliphilus]ERP30828.1 LrgA family protein [Chitinivibrio alkaliphilus ACht1]
MIGLLREGGIIAAVYGVSLLIEQYIPMPASVLSMIILFLLLQIRLLTLRHFPTIVPLALRHLPLFFIPPAVHILDSTEALAGSIGRIILLLSISNILVMGVTGAVVQALMTQEEK